MEPLRKKVGTLLRRRFRPPAVVRLKGRDGVYGSVISDEFRSVDTRDRVDMIWDVLEDKLNFEEMKIISIFPMTPEEAEAHDDE
jgi:acid stress-induced BolA-like protein IbaG/YrbA